MSSSKEEYDLSLRVWRLLGGCEDGQPEPFFANLARKLNKVSDKSIPTAGVYFNKAQSRYEIRYNPDFMSGKTPGAQIEGPAHEKWVLMHELYHAALGHCTYRSPKGVSKKVANIAQDLAINSLRNMREGAPDWVLMPGRGPCEFMGECYEQSAEWYLERLKKDMEENPDKHSGDCAGQFDEHEGFGASGQEGAEEAIARSRLQEAVEKAARECDVHGASENKGWGSVSATIREKIIEYSRMGKQGIDPKKVLQSFIKASVAASKRTSVTKRNRRLPGVKFGTRKTYDANIAFSIDQSGSVSDELLQRVYSWLNEFTKHATITVVPFDHKVFDEKVFVWQKGQTKKAERVLHGGTDFDAPTDWVNKRNFDGHVIITDMCAPPPGRSKCQRMWITDRRGGGYTEAARHERVLVLK